MTTQENLIITFHQKSVKNINRIIKKWKRSHFWRKLFHLIAAFKCNFKTFHFYLKKCKKVCSNCWNIIYLYFLFVSILLLFIVYFLLLKRNFQIVMDWSRENFFNVFFGSNLLSLYNKQSKYLIITNISFEIFGLYLVPRKSKSDNWIITLTGGEGVLIVWSKTDNTCQFHQHLKNIFCTKISPTNWCQFHQHFTYKFFILTSFFLRTCN